MPLVERQTKHPGARDPLDLFGDVRHPLLSFGRPADGLFGAHVEPRHLEACREKDIAASRAENVLRIAPKTCLFLRAVNADAPHDNKPRIRLARVVENLLEGLSVEERLPDRDAFLARHPLAHLEVRLIDLREAGVDDLLVELILLLEPEDLRRLLGEDVDDAVED